MTKRSTASRAEDKAKQKFYDDIWAQMPKRHSHESRICFGIAFYLTEKEAMEADRLGRLLGNTYNGGWYHGMACGRDRSFDKTLPDGTKLYAVTK